MLDLNTKHIACDASRLLQHEYAKKWLIGMFSHLPVTGAIKNVEKANENTVQWHSATKIQCSDTANENTVQFVLSRDLALCLHS